VLLGSWTRAADSSPASQGEAANIITRHPVALQLRTLQTMAGISVERNSTIIFPAQFMTTVQEAIAAMKTESASS